MDIILDSNSMKILSVQRPVFSLTPNLEHMLIKWSKSNVLEYCFLFFNQNVRSLTLCLPTLDLLEVRYVLEAAIFSRATGLKSLSIESRESLSDGDVHILSLLECAFQYTRNIELLILPRFSLSVRMMLLFDGNLKRIMQNDSLATKIANSDVGPHDPFALPFVSMIEEVHVGTTFRSLQSATSQKFPKLVSLHIDFISEYENSDSLRDLIEHISATFSRLQQLSIVISEVRQIQLDTAKAITSKPLTALTSMKNLKSFSFRWGTPILCTNGELIELLKGLRGIEVLHLNERPLFTHASTDITLDALPSISQACPNLRRLALFIDCTVPPASSAYDPLSHLNSEPTTEKGLFSKLESFDLGTSPVRDPFSIARRLYEVLPMKCRLSELGSVAVASDTVTSDTAAPATWDSLYRDIGEFRRALLVGREAERRKFEGKLCDLEKKIAVADLRNMKLEERIKELESLQ